MATGTDSEALVKDLESLRAEKQRLEERIIELYTLYRVSKTLSLSIQLDEVFSHSMKLIGDSLGFDRYGVFLVDEEKQGLALHVSHGLPSEESAGVRFHMGEGVPGRVALLGKTEIIGDLSAAPDCVFSPQRKISAGSTLCVPLKISSDTVVGVVGVHRNTVDGFPPKEVILFGSIAEHVAVAFENARLFQKAKVLSYKDPLTNLYNRRYFFERLDKEIERACRYSRMLSVLMVDVDNFKTYNDSNGHLQGDEALRKISRLFVMNLRTHDVVARFGGEEFIILLPETGPENATTAAEKLRSRVEEEKFDGEASMPLGKLTITVGTASFPKDAKDALQVVVSADGNLLKGKAAGRNRVNG
ncbi:MAG: sensor domain-containing diguanylate cyclase [Deltaproteobacteria bacterium]|nr:sensor domain-containing diguanylate cyclase [Deltaproteobacteria bacterium]